jgi:ABC-2 type transport system permease protein
MNRIWLVARREFVTAVMRKGFLIGVFVMPVLGLILFLMIPRILSARAPQVTGEIVVIDPTRAVRAPLAAKLTPESITARRQQEIRRRTANLAPGAADGVGATARVPVPPRLALVAAPDPGDLDAAKRWLLEPAAQPRRIAAITIAPDAVTRSPGESEYGSYQLFIAGGLDDGTVNTLHESLRLALLEARLGLQGVAAEAVEPTMRVIRTEPVLLAREGEQPARRGFNRILPFVMGILLFLGVMTSGPALMTSTVEEKSSRVVEVLLASLSPHELMWGKLLGQLGVSLLVLAIYIGLGLIGLLQFAMLGLLDPMLIVWLFIFFIVTYLVFGAMMLTIGAAVSQVADAQALMGPVMMLLVLPYALTPIIGANPDSTFSVAISFIPPINTFGMLARMASATPPPVWQPILSLGLSMLAAAAAVWFASKVFRIGLLMHGKPPNLATLVRWARMA